MSTLIVNKDIKPVHVRESIKTLNQRSVLGRVTVNLANVVDSSLKVHKTEEQWFMCYCKTALPSREAFLKHSKIHDSDRVVSASQNPNYKELKKPVYKKLEKLLTRRQERKLRNKARRRETRATSPGPWAVLSDIEDDVEEFNVRDPKRPPKIPRKRKVVSREDQDSEDEDPKPAKKKRKLKPGEKTAFQCDTCHKYYSSERSLKAHTKEIHLGVRRAKPDKPTTNRKRKVVKSPVKRSRVASPAKSPVKRSRVASPAKSSKSQPKIAKKQDIRKIASIFIRKSPTKKK